MKKLSFPLTVFFFFTVSQLHSEDIASQLNPTISSGKIDLSNPMKAKISYEKSAELADLFTGLWAGEQENAISSDGSPLKTKFSKLLLLHKFNQEKGTYMGSILSYDENRMITGVREMHGNFKLVADHAAGSDIVSLYVKIDLKRYRDSRTGPYTEVEDSTIIYFVDPARSNKDALVLGYPQPKGSNFCAEGQMPILKFERPKQ